MSVESIAIVLHHSQAQASDKLVLVGIANHDGDGGAWPSVATLAKYCNVEPRAIKKSVQRLINLGELERSIQRGGTLDMDDYRRPNRYEILVTCPQDCDRTKNHRVSQRTPGVPADTPPGVPADTPPVSQRTPKPSINHPINSDESSFVSTSPDDEGKCFACGKVRSLRGRFCVECRSSGRDNPMLNCREHERLGCTVVGKRQYPGQDYIVCRDHR